MKHYLDRLLNILRKRKLAGAFLALALVYALMLGGMYEMERLGLTVFAPSAYRGMSLISPACLLLAWVLSRIDFGGGR